MMLVLLILITLLSFTFNMMVHKNDIMHPSCVFSMVFLAAELTCQLCVRQFEILIHWQTVAVITAGLIAFSAVGIIMENRLLPKAENRYRRPQKIEVSNLLVIALIVVYIITILSFVDYLDTIAQIYNAKYHYNGFVYSFSDKIELYDTLTKFWVTTFNNMAVPVPMLYRLGNPVCYSCAMLMIYIVVNNYVAAKEINPLHCIVVLLLGVHIVINGSRSPLFRILTMILILFYVMKYGYSDRTDRKEFLRIRSRKWFYLNSAGLLLAAVIGFMGILLLMGRMDENGFNPMKYLFIYIGAPLVNLDNYIASHVISPKGGLYGAQTFAALYNYIAKLSGNSAFSVTGVGRFAFSNNGIEIGNVYTTYFSILYDFGYWGVVPLIAIIALYYCVTYERVRRVKLTDEICYSLFIFSYLFNDLIMLIFSNRFYASVSDPVFLKMVIVTAAAVLVLFRRNIRIGRYILQKETFSEWTDRFRFVKTGGK